MGWMHCAQRKRRSLFLVFDLSKGINGGRTYRFGGVMFKQNFLSLKYILDNEVDNV